MTTLQLPDNELANLFSYSKCVHKLPSDEKRLTAVVIDGIAAGILGVLLSFERSKHNTSHTGITVPELQHLLPSAIHRKFIESMFLSSKKHMREPSTLIELRRKMSIGTEQLVDLFFDKSIPLISDS